LSRVVLLLLVLTSAARAQELTDEELIKMSEEETIEVFDERPDKPFDRDTEVRMTGEEAAARGAVDLATALDLLPDVDVRDGGRGGFNIDIRGARKGAVSVLIDGVLVSDPYYGTFDISTIPITDIVQIRMSTTSQSPIDGPGGPGGVIEVLTRDAIGPQLVIARTNADTLPSFGLAGTARAGIAKNLALRLSASGLGGAREFDAKGGGLNENRHAATGAARIEYREGNQRVVLDGFLDDRHYISPPSETSSILMIDRETSERMSAKGDFQRGKLQIQGLAYISHLHRISRNFMDANLTVQQRRENLLALRTGAGALVTKPINKQARWTASASLARDSGRVGTGVVDPVVGDVTTFEAAGDFQYERGPARVDAAVGLAVPFGIDANPWPEAKIVAKWRPSYGPVELTATGARKGRVPSLRERFDPQQGGSEALDPEFATLAELRMVVEQKDLYRFEFAPYFRRTNGTIRRDPATNLLANLDRLDAKGFDIIAKATPHPRITAGAAYNYIKLEGGSLDRLPEHRAELWVQGTPEKRVSLLARVRYYGAFYDQAPAGTTEPNLPAYTTVEATATATISKQYMAVLRADDLLDVRPETHLGYFGAGRTILLVLQGQWE
jgi:outer membrane receptor protein involved in Fe transport